MAFIKTTTNREGRIHVYLVEGYRENGKIKHRTLKKFGILQEMEKKEPGILQRLKDEAKAGLFDTKKEITLRLDLTARIAATDKIYGWKILDDIFHSLGLAKFLAKFEDKRQKGTLEKVLKLLVFQRILNPCSKIATFRSQEKLFGDWDIQQNSIYRLLDKLDDIKEDFQLHLHQEISQLTNRSATLVFYDVTNYYFEIDLDDEDTMDLDGNIVDEGLRKRGASKEHRPQPIVQLGLFIDTHGIPISYRLFRGNMVDAKTYLPAIAQVKKQFGLNRIVVVADKGMNSNSNIDAIRTMGDGWLFSQKHRGRKGAPKDIQAAILAEEGWLFNAEKTFAMKSFIRTRSLGNHKQAPTTQEKVVITWNEKYAIREKKRRDIAVEYASQIKDAGLFQQTCKRGGKKYLSLKYIDKATGEVKPFSPIIQLDQEAIDFDEQFDGVNVIVTSEVTMSEEEIIQRYHELHRIEDCFRVTKSNLETRPVYVRLEKRIEGHFFTCFLGLILLRLLQHRIDWKMSTADLIKAMNGAQLQYIDQGYYEVKADKETKQLHTLLGIEWENRYVTTEALRKYAKGAVYNKK